MIEILILVILSMLAGGAVVQHDGMKGLAFMIAGILLIIIFYGGLPGVILGAFGLLGLGILWFNSEKNKPISSLYIRSQKKDSKQQSTTGHNLARRIISNLKVGLAAKYPEEFSKQHEKPIDRSWVKKELQRANENLARKYPGQFQTQKEKKTD